MVKKKSKKRKKAPKKLMIFISLFKAPIFNYFASKILLLGRLLDSLFSGRLLHYVVFLLPTEGGIPDGNLTTADNNKQNRGISDLVAARGSREKFKSLQLLGIQI